MTPETTAHIGQVEAAIEKLKALLNGKQFPDDLRTVIVIGTLDQMIEHHASILLLIRSEKIGSAFALTRSVVEGMYVGLWINFCATEQQVATYERDDELPHTMQKIADAIDERYHGEGFFDDLKQRTWKAMCSYAHTGMLQLGRRFTGHQLKPAYSDAEIYEVTTTITTGILMLASKFFAVQNIADASREAEQLIESYGPAAQQ